MTSVTPYPTIQQFRDEAAITIALNTRGVASIVAQYEQTQYVIRSRVLASLEELQGLFKIVYKKSNGFPCNTCIVNLRFDCESHLKRYTQDSHQFIATLLQVLTQYATILQLAHQRQIEQAIQGLTPCQQQARQMVEASGTLATQLHTFAGRSVEAFSLATRDVEAARESQQQLLHSMQTLKIQEAGLQQTIRGLTDAIRQEQERERKATENIEQVQAAIRFVSISPVFAPSSSPQVSFTSRITSLFTKPDKDNTADGALQSLVGEAWGEKARLEKEARALQVELARKDEEFKLPLDEQIKGRLGIELAGLRTQALAQHTALQQRTCEMQQMEAKWKDQARDLTQEKARAVEQQRVLQTELRTAQTDLAALVTKLQQLEVNSQAQSARISTLETSRRYLPAIKGVFENTALFWEGIRTNCHRFAQTEHLTVLADSPALFINGIKESGLQWLTLAKVVAEASSLSKRKQ